MTSAKPCIKPFRLIIAFSTLGFLLLVPIAQLPHPIIPPTKMKFSKITLALGLGLASSVLAIPQSSAVQIGTGSSTSPSSPSGSTGAASGSTSNSRSTSSSNTYTKTSSSDTSDSDSEGDGDGEGEDGSSDLSTYYISPQDNANAMMVNQIPGGQAQAPGSRASALSLAGSENLNTYSYETGQGNPYANSAVSQIPDGQVQAPGTTSVQAPGVYSVLSNPSTAFSYASEPGYYSAGSYDSPDYEALQDMYGLSSYSSPGSTSGSYSASSTNAYGEGQPYALADTTHTVAAVPHEFTAPPADSVSVPLPSSSGGGSAVVSSQPTTVSEPVLYEGSATRLNVMKVGIAVALFAALMG